ncbi:hypothetical protein ASC77_20550 [Nocardioides sp. Root1257]|uniref:hypothetical protein n=1 Tax=unclassified Nocardioides TaxID=2615069 RepID=UPI000702363F|nr:MULTISPECIES: hypothetical protein [unclassified Nocardioides]KQW45166.1 hypothetical protein ASC77_20550 [Nocardioides sp. Root1257]KRC52561.1 hypothetical protein ASE24_25510 [Nocardioides sp. Root224]
MLSYDTTTITILLAVFLTIAALAALVAVATVGSLVVGHRRTVAARRGRTGSRPGRPASDRVGRTGKQAPRLA